jgi:hypothetical protein
VSILNSYFYAIILYFIVYTFCCYGAQVLSEIHILYLILKVERPVDFM